MLGDVGRSLRALLVRAIDDPGVRVDLDAPTPEWAADIEGPTVNAFLHRVQEDLSARRADVDDVRDERGRVVARRSSMRRYELSYLVSAWGIGAEEGNDLLGRVLETVLEREVLPDELLAGRLGEQGLSVGLQMATPPTATGDAVAPHELWSALGTPLRTSLELVVQAPLVPAASIPVAPPAERIDLAIAKGPVLPPVGGAPDARPGGAGDPAIPGRVVKRWPDRRISERTTEP